MVKLNGYDSKSHSLCSVENEYKYDYEQVSITEVACAMLWTNMRNKGQSCSDTVCECVYSVHSHTLCYVFVYM